MSQMRDLDLAVDRTSEIPLGTQLIWKLRTLIAVGKLKPGDRLPGLREVAESAGERTAPADELSERRALRAEIAALEREVAALDPLGTLDPAPADTDAAAPRVLTAAELSHARDALARRLEQLRGERDRWRIEAQEREAEEAPQSHPSRWREAGIWTGPPRTRVSWTSA